GGADAGAAAALCFLLAAASIASMIFELTPCCFSLIRAVADTSKLDSWALIALITVVSGSPPFTMAITSSLVNGLALFWASAKPVKSSAQMSTAKQNCLCDMGSLLGSTQATHARTSLRGENRSGILFAARDAKSPGRTG